MEKRENKCVFIEAGWHPIAGWLPERHSPKSSIPAKKEWKWSFRWIYRKMKCADKLPTLILPNIHYQCFHNKMVHTNPLAVHRLWWLAKGAKVPTLKIALLLTNVRSSLSCVMTFNRRQRTILMSGRSICNVCDDVTDETEHQNHNYNHKQCIQILETTPTRIFFHFELLISFESKKCS